MNRFTQDQPVSVIFTHVSRLWSNLDVITVQNLCEAYKVPGPCKGCSSSLLKETNTFSPTESKPLITRSLGCPSGQKMLS